MQGANFSAVTEFILIGFSTFPHLQLMFFLLFLLMYLFTLLGNLLIMATIWREHSLHTPMYLFLCALSISEILYTFTIIPRAKLTVLSFPTRIYLSFFPVNSQTWDGAGDPNGVALLWGACLAWMGPRLVYFIMKCVLTTHAAFF